MSIGLFRMLYHYQLRMASIVILTTYLITIAVLMASMALFILLQMRINEIQGA